MANQMLNLLLGGLQMGGQWWENLQATRANQALQRQMEGIVGETEARTLADLASQERITMADLQRLRNELVVGYDTAAATGQKRLTEMTNRILGQHRGLAQGLSAAGQAREARLLGEFGDISRDVLGYAEDRYAKGMGMLEGMGEQERKDIGTQYDIERSNVGQAAVSAGLGRTTILPSLRTGVERERTAAIGRLEDRIRGERLATHAGLSGDVLSTKGTLAANRMNLLTGLTGEEMARQTQFGLTGNELSANLLAQQWNLQQQNAINRMNLLSGLETQRMNLQQGLWGQRTAADVGFQQQKLGILGGIEHVYPAEGPFYQGLYQLGVGSVDPYRAEQSWWSPSGTGAGAALGIALGAGLAAEPGGMSQGMGALYGGLGGAGAGGFLFR